MTQPAQPQQPETRFVAGRSKEACLYVSDIGSDIGVNVSPNIIADAGRGWVPLTIQRLALMPRGFKPRRVYGVDAQGMRGSAIVATTTAPLWTGGAGTFSVLGRDGTVHTMTVTSRSGERQRIRQAPPSP